MYPKTRHSQFPVILLLCASCLTKSDWEHARDPDGDASALDSDCDSEDATVHPGVADGCDGIDNDCDGAVDEDVLADAPFWYADEDADGYGDTSSSVQSCSAPDGYVANADDCDDGDPSVWPGAPELCDGVDNDCDGTVDGADALDAGTWYADLDGDGYGDPSAPSEGCEGAEGLVQNDEDCDDANAEINPDADDSGCEGVDDNCDGIADEGAFWVGPPDDTATAWPYTSIQEAVVDAGSGDTVCVNAGTYYENVVMEDEEIRVIGVEGASVTTVDGGDSGSTFRLIDVDVGALLRGFTIVNGSGTPDGDDSTDYTWGGGISLEDSSATLEALTVQMNSAWYGGGIAVVGGDPTLTDLNVSANFSLFGGGLYVYGAEGLDLRDSEFESNTTTDPSSSGGGLYVAASGTGARVSLTGLTFYGHSSSVGGGVYLLDSEVSASDLEIYSNRANSGGGLFVYGGDVTLDDLFIHENYATAGGGASLSWATVSLSNSTLQSNEAGSAGGGAALTGGPISLNNVDVLGNTAGYNGGGGINLGQTSPTLNQVLISDNTVSASCGGGIRADGGSNPVLTDTTITGNTADCGGGIYVESRYDLPSSISIENSVISCNEATGYYGGGILLYDAAAYLDFVTIAGNSAPSGSAFGLQGDSNLYVDSTIIAYNEATSDGAFYCLENEAEESPYLSVTTSDLYGNTPDITTTCDVELDSSVLYEDPGFEDTSGDCEDWDLHPDADGACSDMGAYGGTDTASDTGTEE